MPLVFPGWALSPAPCSCPVPWGQVWALETARSSARSCAEAGSDGKPLLAVGNALSARYPPQRGAGKASPKGKGPFGLHQQAFPERPCRPSTYCVSKQVGKTFISGGGPHPPSSLSPGVLFNCKIFQTVFRFTTKLSRRYREFPAFTVASSKVNSPHLSSTLVTTKEPTQTHHHHTQSVVYIRVLGGGPSMLGAPSNDQI